VPVLVHNWDAESFQRVEQCSLLPNVPAQDSIFYSEKEKFPRLGILLFEHSHELFSCIKSLPIRTLKNLCGDFTSPWPGGDHGVMEV
jgi:hypothetical protein